jgi:hypothetical protein
MSKLWGFDLDGWPFAMNAVGAELENPWLANDFFRQGDNASVVRSILGPTL